MLAATIPHFQTATLPVRQGVQLAASEGDHAVGANLLQWTEQFDNAAWIKAGLAAVGEADAGVDPLGDTTADLITNAGGVGDVVRQTSTTTAASGTGSVAVAPNSTWTRRSVTAALSTGTFTFSLWYRDPTNSGYIVSMRLDTSGGFVRCSLVDVGDGATFQVWGAKLETGATATGDETNYGRRTT